MSDRSASFMRFNWFALMFFAVAGVLPVTCRAQGFPPLSPEDLKMTSEPKAPGAPAIILYREVDRDDNGRGTVHEDNYYRVKILTEEGRKYGDVEIPFAKNVGEVTHIRARTSSQTALASILTTRFS